MTDALTTPDKRLFRRIAPQLWQTSAGLRVMRTIEDHGTGLTILHVSMSRQHRLPDYQDMKLVKREFMGDHIEAYQIFPKKSEHVNIHKFCLHLWAALEGPMIPECGELQAAGIGAV